ncbi:MAG: 50S ribosomal protein L13 [Clostridia bacterium]|nr:50S ribosomal protein L13 [Clostridia bacterium]
MKSYMANPQNVERKWYLVDAANTPLGRVASQVASILRGKNKPVFTPHVDTGDFVIVINSDKLVLTGKKLTQKYFKTYSGYQGGLKEVQYKKMMEEKSDVALLRAIKGMLPKNAIGRQMVRKLKIYKGAEHPHEAQHPELISLKGEIK